MIFWFSYSAVKKSRPDSARYRECFIRKLLWQTIDLELRKTYLGHTQLLGWDQTFWIGEGRGTDKTSVYTVKEEMKEGQTRYKLT